MAAPPAAAPRPRPPHGAEARVDSDVFWAALALLLVLEGIFPFLSPNAWRQTFSRLLQLRDGQLRFFGLTAILLGLVLLWMLR
jgi:uncharacterized protein YjeT (DUF2065 family)